LAQGRPWISVYESPAKLAEETAYLAVKAARKAKTFDCQFTDVPNGKGSVRTVLLTPKLIDASNLGETVVKDGIWTKEEIASKAK
jgi:ABC-type xylose transport system substrate-binding protein